MKRNPHRGVVLLIVMALLAAFGITALTFLLTTGQMRTAAEQNLNSSVQTFSPEDVLNEAAMQVLRGPRDTVASDVGTHSLLEDMYGANAESGEHELSFNADYGNNGMQSFTSDGGTNWAGRVITNVDSTSSAYGRSAVVMSQDGATGYVLPQSDGTKMVSGKYIVNDRPFQGTTRDYDAPDANNLFLAARDPQTGEVKVRSFVREAEAEVDTDNDGKKDASWLDLGLPARAAADGRLYKPMFAILVEDLDGRINVNTAGDWVNGRYPNRLSQTLGGKNVKFIGGGRGPAEIDLYAINDAITDYETATGATLSGPTMEMLVKQRYRSDSTSDAMPDQTANSNIKGFWHGGYVTNFASQNAWLRTQGTPYDIRGVLGIAAGEDGHPMYYSVSDGSQLTTGLTQVQADATPISGAFQCNPYDVDLGAFHTRGISSIQSAEQVTAATDGPYGPADLEPGLRPYDFDSPYLSGRLKWSQSTGGTSQTASKVYPNTVLTTDSWDIPVIPQLQTEDTDKYLPEILAGFPMDLLRVATFNDINDPMDADGRFPKREKFAKCLYYLLELLNADMGDSTDTTRTRQERNAQWAVNVVDFLDADSVMTPFCYNGTDYVYGCERPELLLLETVAMHSRNTEPDVRMGSDYAGGKLGKGPKNQDDTEVYENYTLGDNSPHKADGALTPDAVNSVDAKLIQMKKDGIAPDGVVDFDQRLRPQGSLFVELYNPWGNTGVTEPASTELYSTATGTAGVDLGKMAGGDSVWRIVVDKKAVANGEVAWRNADPDKTGQMDVDRVINLGTGTSKQGVTATGDVPVYAANAGHLRPGGHALLGPSGTTVVSFSEPDDAGTEPRVARKIVLEGANPEFDATSLLASAMPKMLLVPVKPYNNDVRLSLTEEKGRYKINANPLQALADSGEELLYETPLDKPLDTDDVDGLDLMTNSRRANYRVLHLQRLANPNRAYHDKTNPYITVDSMPVDLTVYNARSRAKEDSVSGKNLDTQLVITTRKRGQNWYSKGNAYKGQTAMIWSQEPCFATPESQISFQSTDKQDAGAFVKDIVHCFGRLGIGTGAQSQPFPTNTTTGMSTLPIPWLTWLNRPPVSPLELLNVPNQKSSMLLRRIELKEGGNGNTGLCEHVPDFTNNTNNRKKILGYMRVPSPQTVTPMVLNRSNLSTTAGGTDGDNLPFAYYSMYREPGKINLNTIYSKYVFAALMNRDASGATDSEFTTMWNSFLTSRGSTAESEWTVTAPFHSIAESPEQSILRLGTDGLLFKVTSDDAASNTHLHPFFRYQNYYRLGNLATTRSNVFAVWITMGLFEVTDSNGEPDMTRELGTDTGDTQRYRAFYIMDRSIPVGFERGKDLNVSRAILLRRLLQ